MHKCAASAYENIVQIVNKLQELTITKINFHLIIRKVIIDNLAFNVVFTGFSIIHCGY